MAPSTPSEELYHVTENVSKKISPLVVAFIVN